MFLNNKIDKNIDFAKLQSAKCFFYYFIYTYFEEIYNFSVVVSE